MKASLLKFDHILIGLLGGIFIPLIIMQFWLGYYSNLSLYQLLQNSFFSPLIDTLKSSLFINLGIFFLFYFLKKDNSARGVVLATIIYGGFYIYYMFFM